MRELKLRGCKTLSCASLTVKVYVLLTSYYPAAPQISGPVHTLSLKENT